MGESMSIAIENYDYGATANLIRYRVGQLQIVTIAENFGMQVTANFVVAGLVDLRGILLVSKS